MTSDAFLVVWNDVSAASEVDDLHRRTREHPSGRLSADGCRTVWLRRALDDGICRHLIPFDIARSP